MEAAAAASLHDSAVRSVPLVEACLESRFEFRLGLEGSGRTSAGDEPDSVSAMSSDDELYAKKHLKSSS